MNDEIRCLGCDDTFDNDERIVYDTVRAAPYHKFCADLDGIASTDTPAD